MHLPCQATYSAWPASPEPLVRISSALTAASGKKHFGTQPNWATNMSKIHNFDHRSLPVTYERRMYDIRHGFWNVVTKIQRSLQSSHQGHLGEASPKIEQFFQVTPRFHQVTRLTSFWASLMPQMPFDLYLDAQTDMWLGSFTLPTAGCRPLQRCRCCRCRGSRALESGFRCGSLFRGRLGFQCFWCPRSLCCCLGFLQSRWSWCLCGRYLQHFSIIR